MTPSPRVSGAHPLELSILAARAASPGFITESALTPLIDDARALPLGFDWFAFERNLGNPPPGIELQLSLSRPRGREFVDGLSTAVPAHTSTLLRSWAHMRGSLALRRVPNFVLEFDPDPARSTPLWERSFCMLGLDAGPHPRGEDSLIHALVSALIGTEAAARSTAAANEK